MREKAERKTLGNLLKVGSPVDVTWYPSVEMNFTREEVESVLIFGINFANEISLYLIFSLCSFTAYDIIQVEYHLLWHKIKIHRKFSK